MTPSTASHMLPNGDMEIVFSFDTTGSMASCITTVRNSLKEIMERLFSDIPGLKIALFAHGDYCDETYVTKHVDFTNNIGELYNFVSNTEATYGGDSDECYELVLREVRTELNWTPGSQRALVLIGDANPHEPSYHRNEQNIDWREETDKLKEMGVKVYGVQCGHDFSVVSFYNHISEHTGGRKIPLDDMSSIVQMLMAVCYREKGPEFFEAFEKEICANKHKLTKTLSGVLDALRDEEGTMEGTSVGVAADASDFTPSLPTVIFEGRCVKRRLFDDDDGDDDATPVTKKQRSSIDKTDRKQLTPLRRTGMVTRSRKHPMALRKRPTIVLPKRI